MNKPLFMSVSLTTELKTPFHSQVRNKRQEVVQEIQLRLWLSWSWQEYWPSTHKGLGSVPSSVLKWVRWHRPITPALGGGMRRNQEDQKFTIHKSSRTTVMKWQ